MFKHEISALYKKGTEFENLITDLKREIINDITELIEKLGGKVQFVTNDQIENGEADLDDAILVHCEELFGRDSHTYVLEKIEVCNPTSMSRALKTLKATCHRLEYHGYNETLTPSLWWFSHEELAQTYQTIIDNIELEEETGTEVEA